MPEEKKITLFDRMIGDLHGLPDTTASKLSTITNVTAMTGEAQTFIVQTYRQRERGDTIFLQSVSAEGSYRIAIPPRVADAIARQRESLGSTIRSRTAKEKMKERMASGWRPSFKKTEGKPAAAKARRSK